MSTSTPQKPRYVTVSVAADYLGTSPSTIRRMVNAGEITGYYMRPHTLRLNLNELEALMQANATRKAVA